MSPMCPDTSVTHVPGLDPLQPRVKVRRPHSMSREPEEVEDDDLRDAEREEWIETMDGWFYDRYEDPVYLGCLTKLVGPSAPW